jgi:hypothetical protein
MNFGIIAILFGSQFSHAACLKGSDRFVSGEFRIVKNEKARLECRRDENGEPAKLGWAELAGCVLTVQPVSKKNQKILGKSQVAVYSELEICDSKIDRIVKMEVKNRCCDMGPWDYQCKRGPPVETIDVHGKTEISCALGLGWIGDDLSQ